MYHIKVMLMITSAGMVSLVVIETTLLSQLVDLFTIVTFFTMRKLQENMSTIIEKLLKNIVKYYILWSRGTSLLQHVVFLSG